MTHIYIDEVMIITADDAQGNPYTSISNTNNPVSNTTVWSASQTNSLLTSGYKWLAQISNKSTTTSQSLSKYRLRVCTNYIRVFGPFGGSYFNQIVEDQDYFFDLDGVGTLAAGGSIYVGWNGVVDGYTHGQNSITLISANSEGAPQYLMDNRVGSNNTVVTNFYLEEYSDDYQETGDDITSIDRYGNSSGNGLVQQDFFLAANELYDTLSSSWRETSRKRITTEGSGDSGTAVTYPNTSYDSDHWENGNGTFGLSAIASGDPHICTLFGENYEFDHLGPIRLFDNEHVRSGEDNDLIVINGLVEPGPGRWANKQYIQKLFVYNAGKTMVVDLGFRGSKVVVERNDGIPYEEEELGFNDAALMYSFDDQARFKDPEDAKEYADLNDVHIPPLVRNIITFDLCGSEEDTAAHKVELKVTLSNVNKYNLQPCRLSIETGNDFDKDIATGCLVHRKYATHCALESLEDVDDLPEPTEEEMKNMPELEIKPKLRNIKWQ